MPNLDDINTDATTSEEDDDDSYLEGYELLSLVEAGDATAEQLHELLGRGGGPASVPALPATRSCPNWQTSSGWDNDGSVPEQLDELAEGDNPPSIAWTTFSKAVDFSFAQFKEVSLESEL